MDIIIKSDLDNYLSLLFKVQELCYGAIDTVYDINGLSIDYNCHQLFTVLLKENNILILHNYNGDKESVLFFFDKLIEAIDKSYKRHKIEYRIKIEVFSYIDEKIICEYKYC